MTQALQDALVTTRARQEHQRERLIRELGDIAHHCAALSVFPVRHLDLWLATAGIVVEPFDATHAGVALDAYFQYSQGKHPANLNYGDCFAYALAKQHAEPLLYQGADFAQTDIDSVQC